MSVIVDKFAGDKMPYITSAYRGRLLANVTDAYTSITFLKVNRTDSATYRLAIVDSLRERADSKVEISVMCKYKRRTKFLLDKYICFALRQCLFGMRAQRAGKCYSSVLKLDVCFTWRTL